MVTSLLFLFAIMILDPSLPGRQRIAGGASLPVYYPRAGYTAAGTLGSAFDPIRSTQMAFPNANGAQTNVPGSALNPQQNA